jgi:hypothetical protein
MANGQLHPSAVAPTSAFGQALLEKVIIMRVPQATMLLSRPDGNEDSDLLCVVTLLPH